MDNYLNGGFLLLQPDRMVFDALLAQLAALEDLSRYVFAEQDFLNELFTAAGCRCPTSTTRSRRCRSSTPSSGTWRGEEYPLHHRQAVGKTADPANRYFELERLWWDSVSDLIAGRPFCGRPVKT